MFFLLRIRLQPRSTLFPYTTLFRSRPRGQLALVFLLELVERDVDAVLGRLGRPLGHGSDVALNERSEEHTSELQSRRDLVCRLLLEKKKSSKSIFPPMYDT